MMKTYSTDANKGRVEYTLDRNMHRVGAVLLGGKEVDFEVILRLKAAPRSYKELGVIIR